MKHKKAGELKQHGVCCVLPSNELWVSAQCSFFSLLGFFVKEELCLSSFECEVLLISCWPLQNIQLTICSFYVGLFISWRLSHFNLPLSTFVWSKLEFVIIFCWLVFLIAMHFRLVPQTPTEQTHDMNVSTRKRIRTTEQHYLKAHVKIKIHDLYS